MHTCNLVEESKQVLSLSLVYVEVSSRELFVTPRKVGREENQEMQDY